MPAFALGRKVTKIVIDAGHGGKDPGARGAFTTEKELTLAIAMRVGKMIQDSMRDVQVVYTRTTDIFPSLSERHEIANKSNADLFISIHINATAGRTERIQSGTKTVGKGRKKRTIPVYRTVNHRETSTSGTETYVLGLHRNDQKEGAIGEYSEQVTDEPGLLNPSDPQTAIVIAQYSQAFFGRSVNLGTKIQDAFAAQGRTDLGVKQKGLEVLAGSAMPGVLVECGFINNSDEEAYMSSASGQTQIAHAIYRGIKAYKAETER
jgi:N-acetylmuramoyl-L-alanine amidase